MAAVTITSSPSSSGKAHNVVQDSAVPFANKTKMKTTTRLSKRLINAEEIEETGISQRGMFILRIRLPLPTIDLSAPDVDSVKKFHKTMPSRSEIGQLGMFLPISKKWVKTV
jgi:hypothetical protein